LKIVRQTVDIVIPVYKPNQEWHLEVVKQYNLLSQATSDKAITNLIIVDDGTSENLENDFQYISDAISKATIISYRDNKGKGAALRMGIIHGKSDYTLYTDHDFPYAIESMQEVISLLITRYASVVIGHRDKSYYQELPWIRVKISHYLKTINRFLLGLTTDDTQCGLKGFDRAAKDTFLKTKTNRFLIDIEFLKKVKKAGHSMQVIDVKSRPGVKMSRVKLRTLMWELWSYFRILTRA